MSTEREPLLSGTRRSDATHATSKSTRAGPLDIPRWTRYAILAGLWSATFLSVSTLVATLLPSISSEFMKSNQASWLGTAQVAHFSHLSGLGGGGIFTTSSIIISDMYSMRVCSPFHCLAHT
ncbi:hypothetical protein ID866_5059 [Astraeus odoratus]|nr:hypothetical protein ID866_5059 [Astraeus odoratus]